MSVLPKIAGCLIIGASHAGVTCAFELRKQGYKGAIYLIDEEEHLPYHKPPLSKAFLLAQTQNNGGEPQPPLLKAKSAYDEANIGCLLGYRVLDVNTDISELTVVRSVSSLNANSKVEDVTASEIPHNIAYENVVMATGGSPIVPPIEGIIEEGKERNIHVMRSADDVVALKKGIRHLQALYAAEKRVEKSLNLVVIGAGYIGLEAAASLAKMGVKVTVIEREERILARVASEAISQYVSQLHNRHGVNLVTNAQVVRVSSSEGEHHIQCSNNQNYTADMILVGVGVKINSKLAFDAGINTHPEFGEGIVVNRRMETNAANVWAIGDCTVFPDTTDGASLNIREYSHVESVQNALDQAKVAAANICGVHSEYTSVPWFWSDQFEAKLQIVGLRKGVTFSIVRQENTQTLSVWHFADEKLVCVEAINAPKAYVLGGRWIAQHARINLDSLTNITTPLTECVRL